jgi:hypothetical protein
MPQSSDLSSSIGYVRLALNAPIRFFLDFLMVCTPVRRYGFVSVNRHLCMPHLASSPRIQGIPKAKIPSCPPTATSHHPLFLSSSILLPTHHHYTSQILVLNPPPVSLADPSINSAQHPPPNAFNPTFSATSRPELNNLHLKCHYQLTAMSLQRWSTTS